MVEVFCLLKIKAKKLFSESLVSEGELEVSEQEGNGNIGLFPLAPP